MYKQCPRKYFYRYIAKLPVGKSIHLVRGSIAHKVMEDVYDIEQHIDLQSIPDETFLVTLKFILQEMFRKEWDASKEELAELEMSHTELEQYYNDTRVMINNFFHYLVERINGVLEIRDMPIKEAFQLIKPRREVELMSKSHNVRGYADAIHKEGEKLVIIDYKTSKKMEITPDYHLQLGIYCMIYEELEKLPDEVGIFFLKHGQELRIPVTRQLVEHARNECVAIHVNTKSRDLQNYPRQRSSLCKWSSGQCEFYDTCMSPTIGEYDADQLIQIGANKEAKTRFTRKPGDALG
jgi:putative RecB family exonuclease